MSSKNDADRLSLLPKAVETTPTKTRNPDRSGLGVSLPQSRLVGTLRCCSRDFNRTGKSDKRSEGCIF
jgi:hypothetical protein